MRRGLLILVGALSISAAPGHGPAAGTAPPAAARGAPAPRGMVAFTSAGACPAGWTRATVADGRMLVGTDTAEVVGRVVGNPMMAEEDRPHSHGMSSATFALPYKSISAADGGNQQGAGAGAHPLDGIVTWAPSGLPFIQLAACVAP